MQITGGSDCDEVDRVPLAVVPSRSPGRLGRYFYTAAVLHNVTAGGRETNDLRVLNLPDDPGKYRPRMAIVPGFVQITHPAISADVDGRLYAAWAVHSASGPDSLYLRRTGPHFVDKEPPVALPLPEDVTSVQDVQISVGSCQVVDVIAKLATTEGDPRLWHRQVAFPTTDPGCSAATN